VPAVEAPPAQAAEAAGEAPPPAPPPQPHDRPAELRTLVREHAAAGNRQALAALAEEAEAALGVEALRPYAAQLGRAAFEAGRAEDAHRWLSLAHQDDPEELTVARDLSRAAERTGRHAEEVALGELCADAIAPHDPLAAAARYRHFARVLSTKVGDTGAAASMLEKALTLVPDDTDGQRDLWALWARRRETQGRALEAWLEAARHDPSDATALGHVAELSERQAAVAPPGEAVRLLERARLAASLAAFAAPGRVAPPLRLAALIPDVVRDRIATPGAIGPLGRLLALLAPYLEPLFPADLARRGATAADRLAPPRAPVVRDALEAAGRVLGARPYVAFLVDRPGVELQVENTQPPALVIPAGVEALPASAVHFLAARAVELLGRGWALTGKFAPKDVGILLELACRFGGGTPPPLGLPPQRADAFLSALLRSVPPSVAVRAGPLGPGAAEELARTDVRALSAAIRRTGARVALLATGDPGAALSALLLLEKQRPGSTDAAAALALPDLRDLALLALSDPFLDLRVAVVG
jgi:tetratricopeptide (TPR) repeat protein